MTELSSFRLPGLKVGDFDALDWRDTSVEGVSWILMAADEPPHGAATGRDGDDVGEPSRPRKHGGACVLIRMHPGRGYPAHRHVGAEDVLVLEGGYEDEYGRHEQGDFVRYPPGSEHAPKALGDAGAPIGPSNAACILFSSIAEGIERL